MMDSSIATDLPAATRALPPGRVRVHAPGRLHLGFLDPAGTLGRAWGSLGVAIAGPETVIELGLAETDSFDAVAGADATLARAREHLELLRRATGCHRPLALRLRSALPPHIGLGSGTQLALAVGRAFC